MSRKAVLFIVYLLITVTAQAQNAMEQWVNKTYDHMTDDERIGQMIMIRAFSKSGDADVAHVTKMIKKYGVGGICFFQGSPAKQAQLSNQYQKLSKVPLLMSIDGEWGLGMRFKDQTISFPKQLMLGAIQDNNLIYEMGREIGNHCKRIGLHIDFAPVVDVNNNPLNPVINDRSFGEDKYNIIAKSYSYMKGLQDVGIMACAKHFPGHGDTDTDSHLDLPVINHSRARLDSVELVPFKAMINQGIGSVMVAHLHIPALDSRPNRPTTLSRPAITDILKEELGFTGLVFTDAMEMKGVTKHFKPGEADAEAVLAGVDVVLLPEDVPAAIKSIKAYVNAGKISHDAIEQSVKKILRAKYNLIGTKAEPIVMEGIDSYLNSPSSIALKERLIESSITLAKDIDNQVPIRTIQHHNIATIAIGTSKTTPFQKMVSNYAKSQNLVVGKNITAAEEQRLTKAVKDAKTVIVSLHDMNKKASSDYGISASARNFISRLSDSHQVILVVFGSPYSLKYFEDQSSIIMAYTDEDMVQEIAAQCIFGAIGLKGKLPVTASPGFRYGQGTYRGAIQRLGYSIPERVGMRSEKLAEIDDLAKEMIKKKGTPGAQIFVAKDNKIVFNKSYGKFTYDGNHFVQNDDAYDVASVTKIAATTLSLMKLYDEKRFDLDAPMLRYFPETSNSNKGALIMRDILAHHARLIPWIPFYKHTVSDKKNETKPLPKYYARTNRTNFTVPVTEKLFMRNDYVDSIWTEIFTSELRKKSGYRYSDLGLIMFTKVIENISGQPLDQYAYQHFYGPLGLKNTGYHPLYRMDKSKIAPSEKDEYFREETLQGNVHDMAASMLGGVSGHAGLFSSAQELGVIMQMLLNGGSYGGKQFITPETVKLFTTRYPKSTRRGLGFDMKELNTYNTINVSERMSDKAFGHLGFTGISAFADPEHDLVIVVVSNRTYPTMENRVFIKNNYRPKVQTIVYESLDKENIIP